MVGKPVNPKCGNRHDNTVYTYIQYYYFFKEYLYGRGYCCMFFLKVKVKVKD